MHVTHLHPTDLGLDHSTGFESGDREGRGGYLVSAEGVTRACLHLSLLENGLLLAVVAPAAWVTGREGVME